MRFLGATGLMLSALAACGGGGGGTDLDATPVDGAVDAPVDAPPGPTAADLFDDTQIRTLDLTVTPADWQWLNDNALLEQDVPADLVWNGLSVARLGLRYKGSVGSLRLCFDGQGNRRCPKLSMKLDFDEYVAGGRFLGLEHLNLHAMMRDATGMKERIVYGLFRAVGVVAPRAAHARVRVNGEDLGLFLLVEAIDREYVQDHFRAIDGGAGNLYKEVWPEHGTTAPYVAALETNTAAPAVDKMVRFAAALAAATPATFRTTLATWVDVPTLVSFLAVDRLVDNWDGFVGWYCPNAVGGTCGNHNYFWYEETARDRMWLLPWDVDNTMQVPSPIRTSYGMPDWTASPTDCARRSIFLGYYGRPPACDHLTALMAEVLWPDYQARTAEVLAGPAGPGVLEAQLDALAAQLAPEVATDAFGPTMAQWQNAVTKLRADIGTLRARVAP
ncbi:MAG: CotH kinase family protein [Myxococcales bacterium]|nr:CotH kinase family protein [Myxococcales bacterium]